MAKEIDENFYIGNKQCVTHLNLAEISNILSRKEPDDNQRRTAGYMIIPDDAKLNGC